MKNTLSESCRSLRIPREEALRRIRLVIREELTDTQREILMAYYFQEKNITQIAAERGVYKSSVCRVLQRAEGRLRKYLKF